MARDLIEPIDIDDRADVVALVEEVRASSRPRLLRRGNRSLAMIVPLQRDERDDLSGADAPEPIDWPEITDEARAAFRAAAGGWKDFDAEAFLEQNRASRDASSRPPVDL